MIACGGEVPIFRPTFTLDTEVTYAAGTEAAVLVPVWGHTAPGVSFTCTGAPQLVSIPFTGVFSNKPGHYRNPVTATLVSGGSTLASDTEVVAVTLIGKDRY